MDHNEIMGFSHPEGMLKEMVVIFMSDRFDHPRIKDRIGITGRIIQDSVRRIINLESRGEGLLARICSLIYMGDFISYYLAILNNEDPTPVDEIAYLKKELAKKKSA
jgi:glucose/mannose-6-phosphate isomerase